MFSKNYWYIGTLTALLIAAEVLAVLYLSRHKWGARIMLWLLAAYVIITQAVDLSRSKHFSFAFSTISYWFFVLGVLVPWRPLKSAAATFCMIAGGVYTTGFLFYPELNTHMGEFGLGYFPGYVIHDVLFFGALLLLCQIKVKKYDFAIIVGLIGLVVMFTELGLHVFGWDDVNAFMVGIVEATVLKTQFFPDLEITWWWYIAWYIVVFAMMWGIWELQRFINKRLSLGGQQTTGEFVW